MPRQSKKQAQEQDESLRDWTAKNQRNHQRRVKLVEQEGRLLALLARLAERQEQCEESEKHHKQAGESSGDPDEFAGAMRFIELGLDLKELEMELVSRLGKNQDEQAALLEEVVEELSESDKRLERKFRREVEQQEREDLEDEMPHRGHLRLHPSPEHEQAFKARKQRQGDEHWQIIERLIGRLLAGDDTAWPQ